MKHAITLAVLLSSGESAYAQTASVPLPGTQVPSNGTLPVGPPPTVPLPKAPEPSLPQTSNPDSKPTLRNLQTDQPGNPYGRAIDLTVNVQDLDRDLGEVVLHIDAQGEATFNGAQFATALKPLLNINGQASLDELVKVHPMLGFEDLKPLGIQAHFDRENVSIAITLINAKLRFPEPLFGLPNDAAEKVVTARPADFSFFLNTSISESRFWNGSNAGWRDPSIYLSSAVRAGPLVVEWQGQFADRFPGTNDPQYRFDRNYIRAVYDLPSDYTRVVAGDLNPEVRFQQSYVQMGGIGFSRQKRRFDSFRTAILQGNRQLLLQQESTVEIYRNGILFQQIQLEPGTYDLGNLPLLSGSNDIRVNIRDGSGVSQSINYQTYLDPIDLDPGDWEASLYVGKLANSLGLSPHYDGDLAITGFYRKAFLGRPAIGVGIQGSRKVKQFSAQTQFLVGGGTRVDVTAAVSHSPLGTGWLAGISYDLALSKGARSDTVNIQAVTQSRYFTGISSPLFENSNLINASLVYNHVFNDNISMQVGANFAHNRRPLRDDFRIFSDVDYRLSRKWSVRAGVDYQKFGQVLVGSRRSGLGFNVALVFQPNNDDRAEARYNYRLDNAQLSYQHSPNGYVGAFGYGGVLTRNADQSAMQGYASYRANRFDAAFAHSMTGTSIGSLTDRQVTNLRVSSSIAFADGAFAVNRRVGDSFAIVEPHASLRGHHVVIGQLLTDPHYRSRSGSLGGAVDSALGSYSTQSVIYDVEDAPEGYDIGQGLFRVRPAYHSGYRLVVGSDAYVTAVGSLVNSASKLVAVSSGTITDVSRPTETPQPFFTNSAGHFAISNLHPGDKYHIELYSGQFYDFTVPEKSNALLDLKQVTAREKR